MVEGAAAHAGGAARNTWPAAHVPASDMATATHAAATATHVAAATAAHVAAATALRKHGRSAKRQRAGQRHGRHE
jgi:hypothetical protein